MFEAFNTKTQSRVMYLDAPSLEVAIKRAKNEAKITEGLGEPDDIFVCATANPVPEKDRKAVGRYGVSYTI